MLPKFGSITVFIVSYVDLFLFCVHVSQSLLRVSEMNLKFLQAVENTHDPSLLHIYNNNYSVCIRDQNK